MKKGGGGGGEKKEEKKERKDGIIFVLVAPRVFIALLIFFSLSFAFYYCFSLLRVVLRKAVKF